MALGKQELEAGLPPRRWAPCWAAALPCPSRSRHPLLPRTPRGSPHPCGSLEKTAELAHSSKAQDVGSSAWGQSFTQNPCSWESALTTASERERALPTTKPELSHNCSHSALCRPPHCRVTRGTPQHAGKARAPVSCVHIPERCPQLLTPRHLANTFAVVDVRSNTTLGCKATSDRQIAADGLLKHLSS